MWRARLGENLAGCSLVSWPGWKEGWAGTRCGSLVACPPSCRRVESPGHDPCTGSSLPEGFTAAYPAVFGTSEVFLYMGPRP